MALPPLFRYASGAIAAGVLLAGCNAGSSQSLGGAVPATSHQVLHEPQFDARMFALTNRLHKVPARHFNHGKSWVLPDAGKQWLLYVSDGSSGTVDIYDYRARAGKLYGQITGFSAPYGQCVDHSGNVYIADLGAAKIYEFAHGGTTPIATATDSYGYPIGCSVDPTTGNVAVSDFYGPNYGPGGIDIFSGGLSGIQTNNADSNLSQAWPGGYDPNGNLYVEGTNASFASTFVELPAGSSKFRPLNGLTIGFPAAVQWDGSYIAATDQGYQGGYTTAINRVTVSGSAVTVVRTTVLTDTCDGSNNYMDASQPFIGGTTRKQNTVVAGNLDCLNEMHFWNYAKGGNPHRSLPTNITPASPIGQSVSPPVAANSAEAQLAASTIARPRFASVLANGTGRD